MALKMLHVTTPIAADLLVDNRGIDRSVTK